MPETTTTRGAKQVCEPSALSGSLKEDKPASSRRASARNPQGAAVSGGQSLYLILKGGHAFLPQREPSSFSSLGGSLEKAKP